MSAALMELPTCLHHGQMELTAPGTPEQAFCGTWYRCPRCGSSVLFTSPALQQLLDQQRAQQRNADGMRAAHFPQVTA